MKIKLFSGTSKEKIEQNVNQFIQDKIVIDIKYSSHYISNSFDKNGNPVKTICVDRVLVVYEDYEEGKIDVLQYVQKNL